MRRIKPESGESLFRAIKRRDLKLIEKLLASGENPNAIQSSDYVRNFTVLMYASSNLFLDGVKALLKAGADVNAKRIAGRGERGGATALHDALSGADLSNYNESGAEDERCKVVEELLKAGADVNAVAHEDTLPLYTAAEGGYLEIVRLLLAAGARCLQYPEGCKPPLYGAAHACQYEVAQFLIEHGAPIDGETQDGYTALMAACYCGCEKLVEFLLAKGAKVNHQAKDQRTPLIAAALYAQDAYLANEQQIAVRVFQKLLQAGANLTMKNAEGESAIAIASKCESQIAADYLRGASAGKHDS